MQDDELEKARKAIPLLVDRNSREGRGPLAVAELVDLLRGQGIEEEAARLTMWYLIDRGAIEFTSDWRVEPRRDEVPAQ
jgi:hypothetical protein